MPHNQVGRWLMRFPLVTALVLIALCTNPSDAQNRRQSGPANAVLNMKQNAPCGDENMDWYEPLVAASGEPISGELGRFKICHGNPVIQWGGGIKWGDENVSGLNIVGQLWEGRFSGQHTYASSGTFKASSWFGAQCYYQDVPHGREQAACGGTTVTVYENIPLKTFTLSQPSVKGGGSVTGTVYLVEKAKKLGGMVRASAPDPASAIPYIIVTANLDTGTFAISTVPVTTATTVPVSAYAGGVTLTSVLTVNP